MSKGRALLGIGVAVVALFVSTCGDRPASSTSSDGLAAPGGPPGRPGPPDGARPAPVTIADQDRRLSDADRLAALRRAQIWRPPQVPVAKAHLGQPVDAPTALTCTFTLGELGGTTPKFDCLLDSGERIRVKYGDGPEIPAEAATTRLLRALGFGADTVTLIAALRCYGCPKNPFPTVKAVHAVRAAPVYEKVIDYNTFEDFEWVALERKFSARPIETSQQEGWGFSELDHVDAARGGAPREHVDALRLLAVFLAHWDNKPENQRLVCLTPDWPEHVPCATPFLMVHDVGATFGPRKVNLRGWERSPIWEDRGSCRVSMRHLPHDGATFETAQISEGGRRFLADLLEQLSEAQVSALFAGARFDRRQRISDRGSVADWVRVFRARVRMITDGPACPRI